MTGRFITALAAASALACISAHAGARSDATLTDVRVQLFALDPSRSDPPGVSFQTNGGSMARVFAVGSEGGNPATASAFGGSAFAPVDARDDAGATAGGRAAILGDAFKGGAEVATSANADSPGASSEASAYLGDGDNFTSFTLSAHTLIVISMVADLSAQAGPAPGDYAIGSAELEFIGARGDSSQESLANALVAAGGLLGAGDTLHETLTVSFANPYDFAIDGTFFGGIDATASAAAPVPEPASIGLLLAALAMMGATRGRSRPRRP
jgi:hypothetical protein